MSTPPENCRWGKACLLWLSLHKLFLYVIIAQYHYILCILVKLSLFDIRDILRLTSLLETTQWNTIRALSTWAGKGVRHFGIVEKGEGMVKTWFFFKGEEYRALIMTTLVSRFPGPCPAHVFYIHSDPVQSPTPLQNGVCFTISQMRRIGSIKTVPARFQNW